MANGRILRACLDVFYREGSARFPAPIAYRIGNPGDVLILYLIRSLMGPVSDRCGTIAPR
jgi:hypothetical protein